MAEADFNELLHAAEQLASEVDGTAQLPRVDRTLRQVLEASHELWARVTSSGAQDIQANLLLGSKGVDLPQLSQKLESLSSRKTFESLEPIPDNDIPSFLKNETENAILSVIESTHTRTFKKLSQVHKAKVQQEWRWEKAKLLNSMLGGSKQVMEVATKRERTVLNQSVVGISSLDQQEMAYAQCLIEYNETEIKGGIQNIVEKFSKAVTQFSDQKVNELWTIVTYMTQIPPQAKGDPLESRDTPTVKQAMISQARSYLENRYRMFMNSVIAGNMSLARRGGIPGTYSLVRSFVGVRISQGYFGLDPASLDGCPLWPLIYYCLRCRDVQSALHCAQKAGPGFEDICEALEELKNSPQHRLSPKLEKLLRSQYRRGIRNTTDPYKRVVFCILGACDVTDEHSEVVQTADDYLWLKLCQVREKDSENADCITYGVLQSLILEEYGERHYSAKEQPHVYFQLLFLTGQWEAALDFLMRTDKLQVHGVHIAIALSEIGLLAMPASVRAALLTVDPQDPKPMHRINMVRLILMYVQKFENSNVNEALHYFFCLRNLRSPEGDNMFLVCVSDLVMETRQFDYVLGRLEPDGCRAPGLVDQFKGEKENVVKVIERVAQNLENKGQYEDAVKLYDLAGMHESVFSLMSTLLSQVVARIDSEPGSLRTRLSVYAQELSQRTIGIQHNCQTSTIATFFTLRDLLIFFDLYAQNQHQMALDTIQKSRLIPFSLDELDEKVKNFQTLREEITRNMPDILLATMNILYAQYNKIKGESHSNQFENVSDQLPFLRERAKAITSFAGTVPYRMPGDTNARLVQMEILMH